MSCSVGPILGKVSQSVVVEISVGENKKKQMLQFWNKERSAKEYELKASKKWIVTSEEFRCFHISSATGVNFILGFIFTIAGLEAVN